MKIINGNSDLTLKALKVLNVLKVFAKIRRQPRESIHPMRASAQSVSGARAIVNMSMGDLNAV
jgi:hypothetical protein